MIRNLFLITESASDLVGEIRGLSRSLDRSLRSSADLDTVVSLLRSKKAKVDTLTGVVRRLKAELRVDPNGAVGVAVPDTFKLRFAELLEEVRGLVEEESRIESLICGSGLPITRRRR